MNNNNPNIPALQFPEFVNEGEWNIISLSKVCNIYRGGIFSKADIDKDGEEPCIHYGELFTKYNEVISNTYSRTNKSEGFRSKIGDILMPSSDVTPDGLAKASAVMLDGVVLGGDMNILRPETNINSIFLSYLLNHSKKEIIKLVSGTTVKHIYASQIINCCLPIVNNPQEQQKIASCLSSLDDTIAGENAKLEALKTHKKGLMQALFPQVGEKVPKLRFPEFVNEGEWEERKLGEVAEKKNKRNKENSIQNVFTNSANFGIVNQRDFFDKDIANPNNLEGYYIVEKDDFVYNPRISNLAPFGPISRNKLGIGIMSPLYSVFKFKEGSLDFIEHFFGTTSWHKHMKEISNQGARDDRMSFAVSSFYEMPIFSPSLPEQQKIASCLSSLDALITAQGERVAQLKQHKKGLMQGLFPQLSESGFTG